MLDFSILCIQTAVEITYNDHLEWLTSQHSLIFESDI